MLVTVFRVLTWLCVIYAVEENAAMILGAFMRFENPWGWLAAWFNPLSVDTWRFEFRLIAPAMASHFVARWLSSRS